MFDDIDVFPLDRPMVRPLDIMPVQAQGQKLLMVRDPMGILEGPAVMAPDPILLVFLQLADGKTTIAEMAQKVTMMSGQIMPPGIFESIVKQLDEALLLQSERFREALKARFQKWHESPTRPYRVFQAEGMDRLKMMKELGEEFRRHRMSSISPPEKLDLQPLSVTGVMAPHIDYQRGGEVYSWAYKALREYSTVPKTLIVLGTSHRPSPGRFIATTKNYDTPLGPLTTDQEMLKELEESFGGDLYSAEYFHAEEHTIELQAVYLKQVYGDNLPKIVPVLVAPFDDLLESPDSPRADEEIGAFTVALRKLIEHHGDNVALVGGIDLAHCGPAFGDAETNDAAREKAIRTADEAALEKAAAVDPDGFFDSFRPDFNERKVCSIGTTWVMLEALKGKAKGSLLKYNQANSPDRSTMVTFAAMAFTKLGMEAKPASRIILLR
jgi:hypothetical protein